MQYQKSMLFWKQENGYKRAIAEPYDDNCDYYSYLKEKRNVGMSPVTAAVRQIGKFCKQLGGSIFKIEFTKDPDDLYNSRVYFRLNGQDAVVYWQTNGIVGINADDSFDLLCAMCEFLERTV